MSRRKQARPKSCKLGSMGEQEEGPGTTEADCGPESTMDSVFAEPEPSESTTVASGAVSMETDESTGEEAGILSDEDPAEVEGQIFHCEMCNAIFQNLDQFMDHRNFDCTANTGDSMLWDGSSRSGTPSSASSGDTLRSDLDPSLTPDNVPFAPSVDAEHPYDCHYCHKAFSRPAHLHLHQQLHVDQMPLKCLYCSRAFRHKRSRDRHMKLHTGPRAYKCRQCSAAFTRGDHLRSHQKSHESEGKPYLCPLCDRSYAAPTALASHMLLHKTGGAGGSGGSEGEELACLHCKETFSTAEDLQSHILVHVVQVKKERLACPTCGEEFEEAEALDQHQVSAHSGLQLQLKCPICLKAFHDTEGLCQHIEVHTTASASARNSPCSSPSISGLDASFLTPDPSATEAATLSSAKSGSSASADSRAGLVCPYCLREDFGSLEVLELHMQSMHSVKPTEIYTCNYCNAPYPNLYTLHDHMNVVHRNQPCLDIKYPCSLCSQQFPSIEALAKHKKVAHGNKDGGAPPIDSVYCVQCSLAFSSPEALDDHMTSTHPTPHSGEKSKTSRGKGRRSSRGGREKSTRTSSPKARSASMSTALLSESQDSTTCDHCNATFHDIKNFQAHMKLHMDSMMSKYSCKQCHLQFATEEQLESHAPMHFLFLTKEYGCTSCMKLFPKPDELQKHLMDIHAHHLYRCSLCKEIFDSKVNMQVHFAVKHSNECKLYKCTQCSNIFRSEMEWQVHVRVNHLHMAKPYRCLFCKESFSTEMELQCHLTTHNKPFKCAMCNQAFHIEFLRDQHMQMAHGEKSESPSKSPSVVSASSILASISSASIVKVKAEKDVDSVTLASVSIAVPRDGPSPLRSPSMRSPSLPSPGSGIWKNSEPLHMCNICDGKFSSVALLQLHKTQDHGLKVNKTSPSTSFSSLIIPSPSKNLSLSNQTIVSMLQADKQALNCIFCSQTFKSKVECEKHMKIHASSGNLKCNICDEVFPSTSILAEHKLQHCKIHQGNACVVCKVSLKSEEQFFIHSQEHGYQGSMLQCIVCRQTLASLLELQMHGKHHFQAKPSFFTCCVCLKSFDSKENLVSKLNTSGRTYYVCKPCYHGESPEYICSQCNQKFPTSALLEVHASTHKQSYQCIKCQESFASEYQIQMHVATHMMQEGTQHDCRLCQKTFETPAKLQGHLIEHTFEGSDFYCSVCGKSFATAVEIQGHVLEHGVHSRKYACSQCKQRFFFSAELENHVRGHGLSSALSELECPVCSKVFPNSQSLALHQSIHEARDWGVRCSLCAEVFEDVMSMQQHFFTSHSALDGEPSLGAGLAPGKKAYQCSECSRSFHSKANLQTHMQNHKSGAKFSCTMCSKSYTQSRNLSAHMRTHKEKPFECPVCNKRFTRKENRKAHMKSHAEGGRSYNCSVCSKSFLRKSHVKDHLKVHFTPEERQQLEQALAELEAGPRDAGREEAVITQNGNHGFHGSPRTSSDNGNGSVPSPPRAVSDIGTNSHHSPPNIMANHNGESSGTSMETDLPTAPTNEVLASC